MKLTLPIIHIFFRIDQLEIDGEWVIFKGNKQS